MFNKKQSTEFDSLGNMKIDNLLSTINKKLNKIYHKNDEFGKCAVCGQITRFKYRQFLNQESQIVQSCEWDKVFTEVINTTNTLDCSCCFSKFRVRCVAETLLNFFWRGKVRSIDELVHLLDKNLLHWSVLETASEGGVFSRYGNIESIVKSEYYDDVNRGDFKNGIRSEDLQSLTFDSNSFDAVISLDVFEHIADPWQAFSEVYRVLKPGGLGLITVPIDPRKKKTTSAAVIEHGEIKYMKKPGYHLDALRPEGTLVFTDFGMDIDSILKEKGYDASVISYQTKRAHINQFVILIRK